jgi:cytochrome c-type biogenesis protein CcmH
VRLRQLAMLLLCAGLRAAAAQDAPETSAVTPGAWTAAEVLGAPRGVALSGATLDAETKRVGSLLRCPVCQGLSIADSPADTAVNMLRQVREMLAAGYTEQQILAYFEHSYGAFVRLEPAMSGINWSLWLAPFAAVVVGGLVLVAFLRRAQGAAPTGLHEEASSATPPADPQLAEYVRRVRALAAAKQGQRREETRQP